MRRAGPRVRADRAVAAVLVAMLAGRVVRRRVLWCRVARLGRLRSRRIMGREEQLVGGAGWVLGS